MASCSVRSFTLYKTVLMCNRTSSFKFFSSLSPVCDKVFNNNWNSHHNIYKKFSEPKEIKCRNFSIDSLLPLNDLFKSSDQSQVFKDFLVQTHDLTGMSWWGTIISASLAMKIFISLPCGVCQQYILSKLELTKIEHDAKVEGLKHKVLLDAKRGNWTRSKAKSVLQSEIRAQWRTLVVKNNCHPFKNFILFVTQFPFWLFMTLSVRKFATEAASGSLEYPVAGLQFLVGGPFWCRNLAAPDPTFILPALNALAILTMSEVNCLKSELKLGNKKPNFLLKVIPNLLRFIAVCFFFISAVSPSGLSLFWTSSSLIALIQTFLLMSPRLRRLLRIPKTPEELTKPYSQLWFAFLEKCQRLFSRK